MSYYNQHDYPLLRYPHSAHPKATVSSSGCGVCCASMVIEGLTGKPWPPAQSAAYSMANGCRASSGTDMARLSRLVAAEFGLEMFTTSSLDKLVAAIVAGAWAIANVGGDYTGHKGLFSSAGHYIVVRGIKAGRLIVWDSAYYDGKYSINGRKGKVTIEGHDIHVLPTYLNQDCATRAPRYYIFNKEDNMTPRFKTIDDIPADLRREAQELIDAGALKGKGGELGLDVTEDMLRAIIIAKRYADNK